MEEKEQFIVETSMDKEDFRKFLYIATFLKRKIIIPIIAAIALLAAGLSAAASDMFYPAYIILMWVILFIIAMGVIIFKVERINKKRIKTDRTGLLGSKNIIKFYEDKMLVESPSVSGSYTLDYHKFYEILECKDYIIFYINVNSASVIRKKDVENIESLRMFLMQKFENRYRII